jgi:hypothetical protein
VTARGREQRPHLPVRPIWLCRVCAAPWPCGPARLALTHEYADDRIGLTVYLASLLDEASADLHRLNPQPGPEPDDLYARFVRWARRWQLGGSPGWMS